MAHQISMESGRAEIAYTGATPWHGLGTRLEGLQTADAMLEAAGMAWGVSTIPVYTGELADDGRTYKAVPGWVAIQRDDTKVIFGLASNRYRAIINKECGAIADALVTEGGAHFEVGGALGQGERCWLLARLPDSFEVVSGDKVDWFFLLAWGHDGKHGVAGKLTPIRVVCNNTLTAAGFGGGKWSTSAEVYIRHSAKAKVNIEEARKALGLVKRQAEQTGEAFQALAACKVSDGDARSYFEQVFPKPTDTLEQVVTREALERWSAQQTAITGLYRGGRGLYVPGVAGTLWGAYNAITEWTDHVYPTLKSGEVSRLRQESVLFGNYGETKSRALRLGLELATK